MASEEEVKSNSEENFEWNVENEIHLFEAMIGHKPVGINKHFHMACISEKFESLVGKPVSSEVIWRHLETMFDLAALDKKESLPFPNDQEDFSLPESEYLDLINEKIALKTEPLNELKDNLKDGKPTPKVVKDSTPAKDGNKKDKKTDTEESEGNNDTDKKERMESENEGKRNKPNKEEKTVKTRAKRSNKDKKSEEDTPQTPSSGSKKEEENSSIVSSNRKEKQVVGKRNLRSRAEELLSNKSVTPPPVKRARRI